MGEVLCVMVWDEKYLKWLNEKADRYIVSMTLCTRTHPRLYVVGDNLMAFRQVVEELKFLPFFFPDVDHPLTQELFLLQTEAALRAADFADQGVQLLTNYKHNLSTPFSLASSCYGCFADTTAIICGAGPSLKEAILTLKARRDQLLIIGCGAGAQALLADGIKPHLVVHVDPDSIHTFSKTDVPLFFQLRTSGKVVAKHSGPKFLMAGAGTFSLETWIEEKLGLESPTDCGFSAVTRATVLARALGCSRAHLVGVDFAGPYMEGAGIKNQEPRPDWVVAGWWLLEHMKNHPEIAWMRGLDGVEYTPVPTFAVAKTVSGAAIWQTIAREFSAVQEPIQALLARFQALFPQMPNGDSICHSLLEQINAHFITKEVLDPIWDHWEKVFQREKENHPDALTLHRILLLKSLADRFCAS